METNFDCIVVGAGPAGLSAALNLRQRGKTVLVVHSGETLLAKAEQVDNYLGMPGLSGKQMMERFTQHARDAGAVCCKKGARGQRHAVRRTLHGQPGRRYPGNGRRGAGLRRFQGKARARRGRAAGPRRFLLRHLRRHAVPRARERCGGFPPKRRQEANFLHGIGCSVTYIAGRRPDTLDAGVAFRAGRVEAVEGGAAVEAVRVGGAALPVQGVLSCARQPRRRTRWCPALRWKTAL